MVLSSIQHVASHQVVKGGDESQSQWTIQFVIDQDCGDARYSPLWDIFFVVVVVVVGTEVPIHYMADEVGISSNFTCQQCLCHFHQFAHVCQIVPNIVAVGIVKTIMCTVKKNTQTRIGLDE